MNFLDRAKAALKILSSSRSLENPANGWSMFTDFLSTSDSGVSVNEITALNFSAVYAANKILSEDVASLPVKPYKKDGNNTTVIENHPVYRLLKHEPNQFMTPFTFFETAQTYLNLWGNFYARIARDRNGVPVELIPIHPSKVEAKIKNQLWYDVEGFKNLINARDMIHVVAFLDDSKDYKGKSPILQAKDVIGSGLALQRFANKFFGSGGNLSGILSTDNKLDEDSIKRLKESFTSEYAGINKSHKIAVLEQGLKYTKIAVEPEAAQFLESRRFSVEEIARWFRIPPHMLADLERATFSNIEHQSMAYVRQTLIPWLVRYEQEFARKLFEPSELKTHYIKFNVDGLLRGDAMTRAEYNSKLFNIGAISVNEIRDKEDMNPIEGGDEYFINSTLTKVNNLDNEQGNQEFSNDTED